MAIVVDPSQFNPAALTVPAVYLIVEPPQASITGAPASVCLEVGTASWGPLNKAQLIGDMSSCNQLIGPVSAAALTDIHDLPTDVWQTLQQAGQLGVSIQGVRVSDGTDVQASLTVTDNGADLQTIVVGGSKHTGDVLQLSFANSAIVGNPVVVSYTVLSGDTLSTIAVALNSAINANAALAAAGITSSLSSLTITVYASTDLDIIPVITNVGQKEVVTVTGTVTSGDVLQLTFTNAGITGNPVAISYTVQSGDTLTAIATGMKAAINANGNLTAAGITATSSGAVIAVANTMSIVPIITNTSSGSPTESFTIVPAPTTTLTITSSSAVTGGTLTALYSGVLGNQIKLGILPGTSSNLVNVLLTAWAGKAQEFYQGLPNSSAFWTALQNVLAGGSGPTQSASQLARFTPAVGSPQGPQLQVATPLSGGTDGRSGVTAADLVGSPTGGSNAQGSGLYAGLKTQPFPQQAWCVGLTDPTVMSTIVEFGAANGILVILPQPINTSVSTAVATLDNYGINNYEAVALIDWPFVFDPVNSINRYVSPTGTIGGAIAALAPQNSPLNIQLQAVITTSRLANIGPYNNAEVGLANTSGVTLISNPIPAGPGIGFVTAVNTSLNNIGTAPIEYSRMTNFLIQSVGANLGQFIGKLQSQQPVDPLRSAVKSVLSSFLAQLISNRQLDAQLVLCEFSQTNNSPGFNTPETIGKHILSVFVAATYLSSVWYLIFTLQGGTTVQVQNIVSPQPLS